MDLSKEGAKTGLPRAKPSQWHGMFFISIPTHSFLAVTWDFWCFLFSYLLIRFLQRH